MNTGGPEKAVALNPWLSFKKQKKLTKKHLIYYN